MTSYRKIKKQLKMQGFPELRQFTMVMSKMFGGKKFPHVKYVNQLLKDNKR